MITQKTIKKLIIAAVATCSLNAQAQDVLVVNQEFTKTVDYEFNGEWHYLSSDLYLFNGSRFQTLLNELYVNQSKKKKTNLNNPKNILITAKIDGTSLGNLSYPIFNFNITSDESGLKTYTTDNYEAIRIIDNLPLSTLSNGKIDCNIDVDVITQDKENKLIDYVATQLKSISEWTTAPLAAAQTFAGELSSLLTCKTANKEYKFNSTIRLYEDQDFSKKIASVSCYSFIPSRVHLADIDSTEIAKYLNSNENPKLDKNKIATLIKYMQYPYIIIVNYKSKYVSEPVVGDETTSETIDSRLAKVKKQYESGLLSTEIYNHEIKLIEYLRTFVELKSSINNYNLNYKNRTTDDFSRMFLLIFDNFRALKNLQAARNKEFIKDNIFKNEFAPTYNSIMTNAEVYLEGDNNLKNIKNIVLTMIEHSSGKVPPTFDAKRYEKDLSVLHSINFPKDRPDAEGLLELEKLKYKLETELYKKVFQTKTNKLNTMQPSAEATAYCETLKNELNTTYCRSCRDKANVSVTDYLQRLDAENNRQAQNKLNNAIQAAKDQIFITLQKERNIDKHFKEDYGDTLPPDAEYLHEDYLKMQQNRENLQGKIRKDFSDQNTTQKDLAADEINYETQDLAKILEQICKKMPNLCNE